MRSELRFDLERISVAVQPHIQIAVDRMITEKGYDRRSDISFLVISIANTHGSVRHLFSAEVNLDVHDFFVDETFDPIAYCAHELFKAGLEQAIKGYLRNGGDLVRNQYVIFCFTSDEDHHGVMFDEFFRLKDFQIQRKPRHTQPMVGAETSAV